MGRITEQRDDGNRKAFVTASGNDVCVVCGVDTGIPTNTPIAERSGYVPGVGQCCSVCSQIVRADA